MLMENVWFLEKSSHFHREVLPERRMHAVRLMCADERQRLFENTARGMQGAPMEIQQRWITLCAEADPAYGAGVARAVDVLGATGVSSGATTTVART
jgi:catalase